MRKAAFLPALLLAAAAAIPSAISAAPEAPAASAADPALAKVLADPRRDKDRARDIHRHPELAFEEHRTAALVAAKLQRWGYTVHRGLGKTGVVGTLKVGDGDKCLGIRADMDALPITEATGLDHASRHPGVMHACGHDGHTAMLLAAARTQLVPLLTVWSQFTIPAANAPGRTPAPDQVPLEWGGPARRQDVPSPPNVRSWGSPTCCLLRNRSRCR